MRTVGGRRWEGGKTLSCGVGCQRAKEEGVPVAREKKGGWRELVGPQSGPPRQKGEGEGREKSWAQPAALGRRGKKGRGKSTGPQARIERERERFCLFVFFSFLLF